MPRPPRPCRSAEASGPRVRPCSRGRTGRSRPSISPTGGALTVERLGAGWVAIAGSATRRRRADTAPAAPQPRRPPARPAATPRRTGSRSRPRSVRRSSRLRPDSPARPRPPSQGRRRVRGSRAGRRPRRPRRSRARRRPRGSRGRGPASARRRRLPRRGRRRRVAPPRRRRRRRPPPPLPELPGRARPVTRTCARLAADERPLTHARRRSRCTNGPARCASAPTRPTRSSPSAPC